MTRPEMIKVLFFASLAETVGRDSASLPADTVTTAADVWRQLCADLPVPVNTLVAVNQQNARLDSALSAGDEVAFFPPVTGG